MKPALFTEFPHVDVVCNNSIKQWIALLNNGLHLGKLEPLRYVINIPRFETEYRYLHKYWKTIPDKGITKFRIPVHNKH